MAGDILDPKDAAPGPFRDGASKQRAKNVRDGQRDANERAHDLGSVGSLLDKANLGQAVQSRAADSLKRASCDSAERVSPGITCRGNSATYSCPMERESAHHMEEPEKMTQATARRFLRPYTSLNLEKPMAKPAQVSSRGERKNEFDALIYVKRYPRMTHGASS